MNMAASAILVLLAFLAVAARSQDADLGRSPATRAAARQQTPEAEQLTNRKDKRGLIGPVLGYDGYAQYGQYAVPVAYADAYGPAYGAAPYSPFGYATYKTPAVAAPYSVANGYAGPIAKVAYTPAFAAPAAAAYAAYTNGVVSKVGAYAFPAPYGYAPEGYAAYGSYAPPAVHNAYAY